MQGIIWQSLSLPQTLKTASALARKTGRPICITVFSLLQWALRTFAWWTFRIFSIFFLLGGGERGVRGAGRGGGRFFIENPRRGVSRAGGGGARGAGRVFAGNVGGGGGLNIFFRGRNSHQVCLVDITMLLPSVLYCLCPLSPKAKFWQKFCKRLSGTKKEPKPELFGPDIFQWGRGLPRERVGAKKFDTSLETREIKLFGRDIPGFCRDIPGAPEKFEKKKSLCSISVP